MKFEDKKLLLKEICSRLPYGVKVGTTDNDGSLENIWEVLWYNTFTEDLKLIHLSEDADKIADISEIRPYLFPLSSMTEEQKKEFLSVAGYEVREEDCGRHTETYYYDMVGHENNFYPNSDAIDWCIKNNFDYRGLIPKGLAIDATGLNIY